MLGNTRFVYNYITNTNFGGKKIHFLPQCQSTNDEAWKIVENEEFGGNALIFTHHQTAGRGQRGNAWHSESGKNMLFSVMVRPKNLSAMEMFSANKAVALACAATLRSLAGPNTLDVRLKWPNDLFIGERKLGGILIETRLSGAAVEWLVAGVGINANQVQGLPPSGTSLALELGHEVDADAWLKEIGFGMIDELETLPSPALAGRYRELLLFRVQERDFVLEDGSMLRARIEDVDELGRLVLVDAAGHERRFQHREVRYFQDG